MQFTQFLTLLAATTIQSAAAQGGGSGGGWYVKGETLQCSGTCQPPSCIMLGPPSDDEIRGFCRRIYDDCADGVLSSGQQSQNFAGYAVIGTANFGSGPQHGNNGCPNNDDCFLSFQWLSRSMFYPSSVGSMEPYCSGANVQIYGHYNHQRTGSIAMAKARYFWDGPGPGRRGANVTFTA